jgi:S1-C subfamily serine protease
MTSGKRVIQVAAIVVGIALVAVVAYRFLGPRPKPPRKVPLTLTGVGLYGFKNPDTGKFEITRIFTNSPAEKAGLAKGMVVNKIDGHLAETRPYRELVKMLTGPVGTKVTLEIIDTNGDTNEIEITRAAFLNRIPRPAPP